MVDPITLLLPLTITVVEMEVVIDQAFIMVTVADLLLAVDMVLHPQDICTVLLTVHHMDHREVPLTDRLMGHHTDQVMGQDRASLVNPLTDISKNITMEAMFDTMTAKCRGIADTETTVEVEEETDSVKITTIQTITTTMAITTNTAPDLDGIAHPLLKRTTITTIRMATTTKISHLLKCHLIPTRTCGIAISGDDPEVTALVDDDPAEVVAGRRTESPHVVVETDGHLPREEVVSDAKTITIMRMEPTTSRLVDMAVTDLALCLLRRALERVPMPLRKATTVATKTRMAAITIC